jgi:exopolysaccharide biosynthesis polyprenyl glycosylphosphotransferase
MSTTQIPLGATARATAPSVAHIPRPRQEERPPTPVVEPDVVGTPSRRGIRASAVALDAALSLALASAFVVVRGLPTVVAALAAVGWVVVLLLTGPYRTWLVGDSRLSRARLVLGAGLRLAVLSLAVSPWLPEVHPVTLAQLFVALGAVSSLHLALGVRQQRLRLVVAGHPRDVQDAVVELRAAGSHEVAAVCLSRPSKVALGDVPTYVGFDSSPGAARAHGADAVVVLPGARLAPVEIRRLHWALAAVGAELCLGTGLLDVTPDRTRFFTSGGLHLVHVAPAPLRGPCRVVKDLVERALAAVALVLVSPSLAAISLAVRLDSPGPALYRQTRVGRDGRHFTMYKFRSMSVTADQERDDLLAHNEADGVLFKIQDDPRITRMGGWLRRWSVDEVPQLWNVVRGDMALIGPRPALPEEVAQYDVDPARRLVVKPGLTGLWQVSGRSDLSWAESVRLDVKYVENWSLRLDAHILLRTVRAVVAHRGAY